MKEAGVEKVEDHHATGVETHIPNDSAHSLQHHDYILSLREGGPEEWGEGRAHSAHACEIWAYVLKSLVK